MSYVAGDSDVDPVTGLPSYTVQVMVSEEELVKLGEQKLQPGMPATVFVRTGDRTPFDYLMKPITDSMSLAWREQWVVIRNYQATFLEKHLVAPVATKSYGHASVLSWVLSQKIIGQKFC